MISLREAIELFQREVQTALAAGAQGTARGPAWAAERVTLKLETVVVAGEDGEAAPKVRVVTRPGTPGAKVKDVSGAGAGSEAEADRGERHVVTIELVLGSAAAGTDGRPSDSSGLATAGRTPAGAGAKSTVGSTGQGTGREDAAVELLTELLGQPGFDSSARAAVFCDALRERTLDEARAVAAALTLPAREVTEENIRRSRHLLHGIGQTGPLKSQARASAIVSALLDRWLVQDLVEFVGRKWRTDDTW